MYDPATRTLLLDFGLVPAGGSVSRTFTVFFGQSQGSALFENCAMGLIPLANGTFTDGIEAEECVFHRGVVTLVPLRFHAHAITRERVQFAKSSTHFGRLRFLDPLLPPTCTLKCSASSFARFSTAARRACSISSGESSFG